MNTYKYIYIYKYIHINISIYMNTYEYIHKYNLRKNVLFYPLKSYLKPIQCENIKNVMDVLCKKS